VNPRYARVWQRVVARLLCGITLCALAVGAPAPAHADDVVTYEIVSDSVTVANVEWQDLAGRMYAQAVPLPWRMDARVTAVGDAPPDGSQVRADWRSSAWPTRWVTVRITYQGKVICQSTLDIGNASCYGITKRVN
jgi:hypothetical protein